MALEIGDVIDGKYKIVRLLGEGGMGAVYEGENTRIHRRVAIKVLHSNVAANDEAMTRFEREAQAAGRIGSEHIVEVLDMGDLPGGERYMVMEFLAGEALNDRIERGRMDPRVIAALMVDMLEGLKAAHEAGIVHRDLKPDNVFLMDSRGGKSDFVKIVDFGISKFNSLGGEFSMTRTGAVMGTPYYMAPEQAKGGKAVDHRVDLYAVGVILYQAVVGHVPFQAETFNELLFKIVLETPPPLAEQVEGIDPHFVELVNKAMAREPDDRFQTALEFQTAIKAWLAGQSPSLANTTAGGTPAFGATMVAPAGLRQTPVGGRSQATPGAWGSDESSQVELPVKKGPPVVAIAIAAAVVLAGVGGFFAMSGSDKEEAAAAAAAESERDEAKKKTDAERDSALVELAAEKKKAEEAQKSAAQAEAEAKANQAQLELQAKLAEEKRATQPTAAPPPSPRPQPAPAAAPRPKPSAAPQPSSGRVIRTDF